MNLIRSYLKRLQEYFIAYDAEDENGHYFIVMDAHSRWPEIFFMPGTTSATPTITIL